VPRFGIGVRHINHIWNVGDGRMPFLARLRLAHGRIAGCAMQYGAKKDAQQRQLKVLHGSLSPACRPLKKTQLMLRAFQR
jgi:hypothetical protein